MMITEVMARKQFSEEPYESDAMKDGNDGKKADGFLHLNSFNSIDYSFWKWIFSDSSNLSKLDDERSDGMKNCNHNNYWLIWINNGMEEGNGDERDNGDGEQSLSDSVFDEYPVNDISKAEIITEVWYQSVLLYRVSQI